MLEYILLGFLMRRERSGYDLKQSMLASTAYFFDASFGSIYPALKKLTEKEFVVCRESVENGKYKKLYAITENGKAHFLNWLSQPVRFAATRFDYMVQLFFYDYLPRETAVANIKTFVQEVTPYMERLSVQESEAAERFDVNQYYSRYSTMVFGIRYYETMIDWCNKLIKHYEGESL